MSEMLYRGISDMHQILRKMCRIAASFVEPPITMGPLDVQDRLKKMLSCSVFVAPSPSTLIDDLVQIVFALLATLIIPP